MNINEKRFIKYMKKLFLFFAALFMLASCSREDDVPQFNVEFLPVDSVDVPESFAMGNTYQIKVHYKRPTDCYFFNGFYYEEDGDALLVAVQTLVIQDAVCEPLTEPESAIFEFECSPNYTSSTYLFKFYKGDNEAGDPTYIEVEVPVMQ